MVDCEKLNSHRISKPVAKARSDCAFVQEVFHVYLNKFEKAVSHLFLVIFGNN